MNTNKVALHQKDANWILTHLSKIPTYNVTKIEFARRITVNDTFYNAFDISINHDGIYTRDYLGYKHKDAVSLFSQSICLKELNQEFSYDDIHIGTEVPEFIDAELNGKELSLNTVLFYSDYVSYADYIFGEKNELIGILQWLRDDTARDVLNLDKFGKYVLTHYCE